MIVVTGNWLISDGSLSALPRMRPIADFFNAIPGLACRAGIAPDGSYSPIERIDLVLAGDTFDGLTSRRWLDRVRPWHGGGLVRKTIDQVAADSLRAGRELLKQVLALRRMGLKVPSADRRHRPIVERTVRIPVHVTLIPGDRDAMLERSSLRTVVQRLGIGIGSCWEQVGRPEDHVVVRHGHELDPLCAGGFEDLHAATERDSIRFDRPPSLSESLAVELLAAFADRLSRTRFPAERRRQITRAVARASWTAAPFVLAGWLREHPLADVAAQTWRWAVDNWHAAASVDPPISPTGFDAVDALATWLHRIDGIGGRTTQTRPAAACADGWLDMQRNDFARLAASAGGPSRIVLGHPPSELSMGSPDADRRDGAVRVIAIGAARTAAVPGARDDTAPAFEVTVERSSRDDDPGWIAIPRTAGSGGVVSSPGLRREAA